MESEGGSCTEGLRYWAEKIDKHRSIFFTPHFLEHFDIRHVACHEVLLTLLLYKSLQLGFSVEHVPTGERQIHEQDWKSNVKFICYVGHRSWYNKNAIPDKLHQVKPCTWYVRYKRCDENDE